MKGGRFCVSGAKGRSGCSCSREETAICRDRRCSFMVLSGLSAADWPGRVTETVLDFQPGKLQLLQMEGMLSGQARWELTPEGDATRLTTTFDYALPGGAFGKIADALMVKRMNGKSLEEALNNFKALVERQ